MPTISQHIKAIRFPLMVFLALSTAFIILVLWTHSRFPDSIAVHYGLNGEPDRFSAKSELTFVMIAVAVVYLIIFAGFSIFTPKIPVSLWNLPNKTYWLSPEHAKETVATFCGGLLWFGCIMVLFMAWIHWDVFQANVVREQNRLQLSLWHILAFLAATVVFVVWIVFRFRKTPE